MAPSRPLPSTTAAAARSGDADNVNSAYCSRCPDVVIQALGVGAGDLFQPVSLFSDATRILVSAMERRGIKRLIAVTGFGAGDSRDAISCLQLLPFRLFLGRAYDDKDVQECLIKNSRLDWTIVRPGTLTNGPRSGHHKVLVKSS
ncbi:MAG: NAD(P)H-binding protein [Methyloceanibacter sp.]